jgi:hypothetical protein
MEFSATHHASFKTKKSMGIRSQVNVLVPDMLRGDDDDFSLEALSFMIRFRTGIK